MTHRTTRAIPSSVPRSTLGLALLAGSTLALSACVSGTRDDSPRARPDAAAQSPATDAVASAERATRARLLIRARAVDLDATDPSRGPSPAPAYTAALIPPGLDAREVAPLTDAERSPGSARMTPLTSMVDALRAKVDDTGTDADAPDADAPPAAANDRAPEATRAYVRGLLALRAGNAADAVAALEDAATLDPRAPEIWQRLGEAQIADGRRASGMASLRRAVALGSRDARTLFTLAREASRADRHDDAAQLLAAALFPREPSPNTTPNTAPNAIPNFSPDITSNDAIRRAIPDAGLRMLCALELAGALEELGRTRASLDAARIALDTPFDEILQTAYREEVQEALRFRGARWMAVGDLALRLDDVGSARAAYEAAAESAMLDSGPLLTRRVHVALRAGNPARAADVLLAEFDRVRGNADDQFIALVEHVASASDIGPLLADALREPIAEMPASDALAADEPRASGVDGASAVVRARVAMARAAALGAEGGRSVLQEALRAAPMDGELLLALVRGLSPAQVVAAASAHVEASPRAAIVAGNVLLADGRAVRLVLEGEPENRAGALLLAATVAARTPTHARAVEHARRAVALRPSDAEVLGAAAQIAAATARWDDARTWTSAIDALPVTAESRRAKAYALHAAQRTSAARDAIDALLAPASAAAANQLQPEQPARDPAARDQPAPDLIVPQHAEVGDAILAAELALTMGDAPRAAALVALALDMDRYDERGYEATLRLHGPRGPVPDAARVSRAGNILRQMTPGSRLLRLITVQELASRNLWSPVAEAGVALLGPRGDWPDALDLIARAAERSGDARVASRVVDALVPRLAQRPESPGLRIAYARALVGAGRASEAVEALAAGYAATPLLDLLRERESIVREALASPAEADALAQVRLDASAPSIDVVIERADALAARGAFLECASLLRTALPTDATLTGAQGARLVGIALRLAAEKGPLRAADTGAPANAPANAPISATDPSSPARDAIDLLDALASRPEVRMPEGVDLARVDLLAAAWPDDTQRLIDAWRTLSRRHPERSVTAIEIVAGRLLRLDRAGPALAFLRGVAALQDPPDPRILFETYRLTVIRGSRDDHRALVDAFPDAPRMEALYREISGGTAPPSTTINALRTEIAHAVGNALSSISKIPDAHAMYRFALSIDPDHAWTNNNLGYAMLVGEGDFAEAAALIERAYSRKPREASIIDSLGWVRYHQGVLADERDAAGQLVREGALTLLERAANSADETSTPEVFKHLGDALWRAGKREDAIMRWDVALRTARTLITEFESQQRLRGGADRPAADPDAADPEPRFIADLRDLAARLAARLDATREGREPPLDVQRGVR
jgi:tetratricopeptide (TPR) repeat protein